MRYRIFHYEDGTKIYFKDGAKHREDGPAVECPDGYQEWVIFGSDHYIDGPSNINNDGLCQFNLYNKNVSFIDWKEYTKTNDDICNYLKLKYSFDEYKKNLFEKRNFYTPIDKYFNSHNELKDFRNHEYTIDENNASIENEINARINASALLEQFIASHRTKSASRNYGERYHSTLINIEIF